MSTVQGLDIANYQGPLSPEMVACFKRNGIAHVVVRASLEDEGKHQLARQQLQALKDGGIGVSVYLWCYYSMDPAQQAQQLIDWYADLQPAWFWLDCEEVDPRWNGDSPQQRVAWLQTALSALERAGKRVGVYSGRWWWSPYMADSTAFSGYPLWVAEYDDQPDLDVFYPYSGWQRCAGKQFTGSGQLCGLSPVDLDVFDAALFAEAPTTGDDTMADAELINLLGYLRGDLKDALQAGLDGARAAKTAKQRAAAFDAIQAAISTLAVAGG